MNTSIAMAVAQMSVDRRVILNSLIQHKVAFRSAEITLQKSSEPLSQRTTIGANRHESETSLDVVFRVFGAGKDSCGLVLTAAGSDYTVGCGA
jgi:Tfp pilus assembly protein PilX